jgi:hypothetical protein
VGPVNLKTIRWYERDPSHPVYITAAGWSTRSVSESVQRTPRLARLLDAADNEPGHR